MSTLLYVNKGVVADHYPENKEIFVTAAGKLTSNDLVELSSFIKGSLQKLKIDNVTINIRNIESYLHWGCSREVFKNWLELQKRGVKKLSLSLPTVLQRFARQKVEQLRSEEPLEMELVISN